MLDHRKNDAHFHIPNINYQIFFNLILMEELKNEKAL